MTSSIWLRPQRGARGPTSRWSRAEVATIAIGLADAGGIDAVTMRSVAQAMGTAPASVYRVVRSRHELLELMADAVTGEFVYAPDLPSSGARGLLVLARQARDIYLRHPWMVESRSVRGVLGPNAVTYLDAALSTLEGTPHRAQEKLEAIGVLSTLVLMLAEGEIEHAKAGPDSGDWREATAAHLVAQADAGRHPHLAAALVASAIEPADPGVLFDRVVMRTLTGLLPAD